MVLYGSDFALLQVGDVLVSTGYALAAKVTKINKSSYTLTGIKMKPLQYEEHGINWGVSSPYINSGFTFNIPFDTLERSVYCNDWEWQSVPYGNGQAEAAHCWRVWNGGAVFRSFHIALD
jgi:hypothetical protein